MLVWSALLVALGLETLGVDTRAVTTHGRADVTVSVNLGAAAGTRLGETLSCSLLPICMLHCPTAGRRLISLAGKDFGTHDSTVLSSGSGRQLRGVGAAMRATRCFLGWCRLGSGVRCRESRFDWNHRFNWEGREQCLSWVREKHRLRARLRAHCTCIRAALAGSHLNVDLRPRVLVVLDSAHICWRAIQVPAQVRDLVCVQRARAPVRMHARVQRLVPHPAHAQSR
eukprot:2374402-Rhodomonas_salina.2